MDSMTRREFAERLGALGALWMAGRRELAHSHGFQQAPRVRRILTAAEAREVAAISARILPSDSGAGATEAGVVHFIDTGLATFAKVELPAVRTGLADLAARVRKQHPPARRFSALPAAQQDAVLKAIEKSDFFQSMRAATIAGMLALPSYGGNRDYVGWKAVGLEYANEYAPPFGYYDRPEVRRQLLGTEDE